jgi:hypothetical protein
MSKRAAIRVVLMLCLLLLAGGMAGCFATNPVNSFKERYHAPPLNEQVLMILDTDADRRREGVNHLAASNVAKDEQSLLLFAEVAANDSAAFVRSAAVNAVANGEDPSFAYVLIDALADPSAIVRADAAKGLGQLPVVEAVGPLIATATDRDEEQPVRVEAIRSLRNYRDTTAARTLVSLLADRQLIIRHEAHESLVEMYQVDLGDSPRDWPASALASIPAPIEPVPSWRERLEEKQAARRQAALDEEQAESERWHEDYRQRYPTFPQEDEAEDGAAEIASDGPDDGDVAVDEPDDAPDGGLGYNPDDIDDEWDFEMNEDPAPATPTERPSIATDLPDANDMPLEDDPADGSSNATDNDGDEWDFELVDDTPDATATVDEPDDAVETDDEAVDIPAPPAQPVIETDDEPITDTPPTQPPAEDNTNGDPGLNAEDIFD